MKTLLITLINFYQKLLSPDHSLWGSSRPDLQCRYFPSCSEYAKQSLEAHGAAKGSFLAVARVCRCHPWAASGVDPVLNPHQN